MSKIALCCLLGITHCVLQENNKNNTNNDNNNNKKKNKKSYLPIMIVWSRLLDIGLVLFLHFNGLDSLSVMGFENKVTDDSKPNDSPVLSITVNCKLSGF